jgi:hypothetical protein
MHRGDEIPERLPLLCPGVERSWVLARASVFELPETPLLASSTAVVQSSLWVARLEARRFR